MQKEKTVQFWDNYHSGNDSEEWISKPGEELLEMLFDQIDISSKGNNDDKKFQSQKECLSILEIGCGTSTLVRDLKVYIEQRNPMIDVIACGTDVSKVCIDINRKRDCNQLTLAIADEDDKNSADKETFSHSSLSYKVLNVLATPTSTLTGNPSHQNWDLIIDKGCLDTLLFRSRKRGAQNKAYPESLRVLLDNIHGWQGKSSIAESAAVDDGKQCAAHLAQVDKTNRHDDERPTNKQNQLLNERPSIYLVITPRRKLKAVRDYAGFSSVRRYNLPENCRSTLERKNHNGKKNGRGSNGYKGGGESQKACNSPSPGYMYACTRNSDYQVGVSVPFPIR